jgi:hypothetical protein
MLYFSFFVFEKIYLKITDPRQRTGKWSFRFGNYLPFFFIRTPKKKLVTPP